MSLSQDLTCRRSASIELLQKIHTTSAISILFLFCLMAEGAAPSVEIWPTAEFVRVGLTILWHASLSCPWASTRAEILPSNSKQQCPSLCNEDWCAQVARDRGLCEATSVWRWLWAVLSKRRRSTFIFIHSYSLIHSFIHSSILSFIHPESWNLVILVFLMFYFTWIFY